MNEKVIKRLNESPIFALSKCSNELAHSNFWAWLMELKVDGKNPFIDAFIPGFNLKYKLKGKIVREKNHMDLFGECEEGYCFIIENKLKAIPTEDQLKRYDEVIGKKKLKVIDKILTGINPGTLDNWTPLSYEAISKNIKTILIKENINKNNEIIVSYLETLDNINILIKNSINQNKNMYIFGVPKGYSDIKMDAITMKVSASNFCEMLKKKIGNKYNLPAKYGWLIKPEISATYSNSKPIITVIYRKTLNNSLEEKNEIYRIGIQIQGSQFRIYAGRGKKYKGKSRSKEQIFDALLEKSWFENYKNKLIRTKNSSMKSNFCKYSTDNYVHVYQYWNINNENKKYCKRNGFELCSYNFLVNAVEKELDKASKIIKSNPNLF